MSHSRARLLGLLAALAWLVPLAAQAAPERVRIDVMVSLLSNEPGDVDARASKLDEKLRSQFRYQSLRVLESKRLKLAIDEVGSLRLPNGRALRVRPLHVGENGVLIAVSLEGLLETDLRVRSGRLVVIGSEPYQGGKLVISLEPSY